MPARRHAGVADLHGSSLLCVSPQSHFLKPKSLIALRNNFLLQRAPKVLAITVF